jgi:hypothetical protein
MYPQNLAPIETPITFSGRKTGYSTPAASIIYII